MWQDDSLAGPPPPKPLTLYERLNMMHREMTLKLDPNLKANLFLFEHMRGLATHIAPSYPFSYQEAILATINQLNLPRDQAAQGQKGQ